MKTSSTYGEIWAKHSAEALETLAEVKRFLERWSGDPRFRERLSAAEDPREVAAAYGLSLDPADLRPLYAHTEAALLAGGDGAPGAPAPEVVPAPGTGEASGADSRSLEERREEALANLSPPARLWHEYSQDLLSIRGTVRDLGRTEESQPGFDSWRMRQIRRLQSECGSHADAIVHPIAAFELSDGCSVGCWFCGISAERFQGYWPYTPENAETWRRVLGHLKEEMGPAARTGFLYWATDPLDNPDYPEFLDDFLRITDYLPQTTTALALRDLDLTRRMLALFDRRPMVTNRFSVLTTKQLDRIHATFSARELLGVELVLQMKGSRYTKSPAGKARERREKRGEEPSDNPTLESSTIACVTGFLINMVRGTVRLVSPCRPTERWKDGYKVWDERRFDDAESFRDALRSLIAERVAPSPGADTPIRFRWDLRAEPREDGFELRSSTQVHRMKGTGLLRDICERIATGSYTYRGLRQQMLRQGTDPFLLESLLDKVFQAGVIAEPLDLDADGNLADLPSPSLLPILRSPAPEVTGSEIAVPGGT